MNTNSKYRIILIGCLLIYGFIYCETFLIPHKYNLEIAKEIYTTGSNSAGSKVVKTFLIITDIRKYRVSNDVYVNSNIGDTLSVTKGAITNAAMKISNYGFYYSEIDIRFLINGTGVLFVPFLAIVSSISIFFIHKMPYKSGRQNLVVFLTIATLIIFVMYVFLQ